MKSILSIIIFLGLACITLQHNPSFSLKIEPKITRGQHPETLKLAMKVDGNDFLVSLTQNKALFAPHFKTYEMGNDGRMIVTDKKPNMCHYIGNSDKSDVRDVVVSTCTGKVEGSLYYKDERYVVEPQGEEYGLFKASEKRNAEVAICGEPLRGNHDHDEKVEERNVRSVEGKRAKRTYRERKYVEYLVYNDNQLYTVYGNDSVTDFSTAVVAQARSYYENAIDFDVLVEIVLVGQVVMKTSVPWSVPALDSSGQLNVTQFLNDVTTYFATGPSTPVSYDNIGIYSGYHFTSPIVGLAWLGTMCDVSIGRSIHVIQALSLDVHAVGSTVAHEMGHNFNMQHDVQANNGCPDTGYVMQAVLYNVPTNFSSCSTNYINTFFNTSVTQLSCLDNVPSQSYDATCGNGFVDIDKGEQCDCGSIPNCDPCCNTTTCKLVAGAQCGSYDGPCCSNCKLLSSGTVCQTATDTCQNNAVCNGVDSTCAINPKPTGTTCGTNGACYLGSCSSLDSQCRAQTGFSESFVACSHAPSQPCGQLLCGVSGNPGNCYQLNDYNGNAIQIENGVPCGNSSVCYNSVCTATGVINTVTSSSSSTSSDASHTSSGNHLYNPILLFVNLYILLCITKLLR